MIPSLAFPGVPQLRGSKARQDRRGGERRHPSEVLQLLGSPSPPAVGAGSPFLQERFGAEEAEAYLVEEPQFIKKMMHFETIILKDACLIF